MKLKLARFAAAGFATLLVVVLAMNVVAQDKAGKAQAAAKVETVQGIVERLGKGTSTITVRTRNAPNQVRLLLREVVYNAETRFRYGHTDKSTPGSAAAVKEKFYITCIGTFDAKNRLLANECVYREEK